jgi:acetyl esterase
MYPFDPDLLAYVGSFPDADLDDLDTTRQRVDAVISERRPSIDWSGVEVELARAASVPIAVYRPSIADDRHPAMVWFHGGGFVLADERSDDPLLARVVRDTGIVVVSVGYRLAPEHPCPAALDDGRTVLAWCRTHADRLAIDPAAIALGGRSAGAALAAGVALADTPLSEPPIAFLYLGEPVLDARLATPSMRAMDDTPVWRRRDAERSWQLYTAGRPLAELPPYACPATCDAIDHLPPTYLTVNEIDPLRDEGLAFAQRLVTAGVPTEMHLYPGAFHGAMSFPSPITERMQRDLIEVFRRRLGRPG